jgi:hypothetical protein
VNAGRDRDRTLDQALKQALGARADVPASDVCLDAETLAAWMDDGLDPAAAALAEAHVSSCARCQTFVAAMARTAPDVPASGPARSSLWRWWLAPVAAAAAAAVVWMVVPEQRVTTPSPTPREEVAQAPSTGFGTEPPPPASLVPPPPPPGAAARPPDVARRRGAAPEAAARESSKGVDETTSTEAAARARTPSADAQERPAAPAPSTAFSVDLTAARDVASPDPLVRWRVGANGVVDYTADGGRTWERVSAGVTTAIVAGSSPAPGVCWLVGHGGLVLVTSDGRTFARVSAPGDADLAAVEASDALVAVVTAVDGRAFVTEDGGRTWRRRE